MVKTLTLKVRSHDGIGNASWHDADAIMNALTHLGKGRELSKAAIWMQIAADLQIEMDDKGYGKVHRVFSDEVGQFITYRDLPELTIKIGAKKAHALWESLSKLSPDKYVMDGAPLHLGLIYLMRKDLVDQLGEKLVEDLQDRDEEDELSEEAK